VISKYKTSFTSKKFLERRRGCEKIENDTITRSLILKISSIT
jgi:hypothetical protein